MLVASENPVKEYLATRVELHDHLGLVMDAALHGPTSLSQLKGVILPGFNYNHPMEKTCPSAGQIVGTIYPLKQPRDLLVEKPE